ncbi:hypothetical protein [Aquimarina pacifica]|uniref:hypothetical protein n=1 Tax=Aquimarina pacifica TaxID=1296415 RepID=UPI0004710487|nr:hypothetical protein [Aquimarina pacifica]
MDNFEKYIQKNKDQFDEHKVDHLKIWNQIETELETPKTISLFRKFSIVKVAATLLILIGAFSIVRFYKISEINFNSEKMIVNQELRDIDVYYKNLVSFQVQLVQKNTKLLPEEKKEFLSFMDELDEEYNTLKKEMTQNLNNEYILEAIINNYKKRIELIENLLKQINTPQNSNDNEGYIL